MRGISACVCTSGGSQPVEAGAGRRNSAFLFLKAETQHACSQQLLSQTQAKVKQGAALPVAHGVRCCVPPPSPFLLHVSLLVRNSYLVLYVGMVCSDCSFKRSWSHALVASVLCEYPFHFNIQSITKVRPLTRHKVT